MVLGHVGLINWWGWGYSMCNNVPIFVYFFSTNLFKNILLGNYGSCTKSSQFSSNLLLESSQKTHNQNCGKCFKHYIDVYVYRKIIIH